MDSYARKPQFLTDPITDDYWQFVLDGPPGQGWVWRRVDTRGSELDRSRPFPSCLAAVRDARAHGFSGRPDIARPAPTPVQRRRDRAD